MRVILGMVIIIIGGYVFELGFRILPEKYKEEFAKKLLENFAKYR